MPHRETQVVCLLLQFHHSWPNRLSLEPIDISDGDGNGDDADDPPSQDDEDVNDEEELGESYAATALCTLLMQAHRPSDEGVGLPHLRLLQRQCPNQDRPESPSQVPVLCM